MKFLTLALLLSWPSWAARYCDSGSCTASFASDGSGMNILFQSSPLDAGYAETVRSKLVNLKSNCEVKNREVPPSPKEPSAVTVVGICRASDTSDIGRMKSALVEEGFKLSGPTK